MISRKSVIQKGFRIDSKMAKQIDVLSQVTGRSQNDLASLAFQKFLIENAMFLIEAEIQNDMANTDWVRSSLGGLTFEYNLNFFLLYSQNKEQKLNSNCLDKIYFELDENNERDIDAKMIVITSEVNKLKVDGFELVDAFYYDRYDIDDKVSFEDELHDLLLKIDPNFNEMQEWIKKEFNYS